MASGSEESKYIASILLVLNFILYFIVTVISSWAVNHAIENTHESARSFPIYFPIGNMATGFFIIFAVLAGVIGFTTSLTGLYNVSQWNPCNLRMAATSFMTWVLTLLAMGFACKEIELGWTNGNLVSSMLELHKLSQQLPMEEEFEIPISSVFIFSNCCQKDSKAVV